MTVVGVAREMMADFQHKMLMVVAQMSPIYEEVLSTTVVAHDISQSAFPYDPAPNANLQFLLIIFFQDSGQKAAVVNSESMSLSGEQYPKNSARGDQRFVLFPQNRSVENFPGWSSLKCNFEMISQVH